MKSFIIFCLLPLQLLSQDLTGVWTGFLQVEDTKLPYELVISGSKDKLSGYSMLVFTFNGVENVGIKTMEMKIKRGSIAVEDGELVYDNYTTPSRKVKIYANLVWVGRDSNLTLAGTFATRSMDMRALNENSFKGTIRLQKKGRLVQTRLMSQLAEMNLLPTISFVPKMVKKQITFSPPSDTQSKKAMVVEAPKREMDIIRSITYKSDSLKISLYDNGVVDGDTVSLILDGRTILSKQGLTDKAMSITIATAGLGDSSQLIMFAENLGRIPPNSGLLILQSGYERYQVRFSGDLQKNSAIILRRRR